MTRWRLVTESLRHYWRGHVGLLLGSALAAAVLSGSLLVGDSVRASLRRVAAERLGAVRTGVLGGERWFTQRLAEQVEAAPLIVAQGAVSAVGKDRRANAIQVLGVGEAFWKMAPGGSGPTLEQGQVGVSPALAARLGVAEGDTVIVRLEQPSSISRDAPLSGATNEEVTLRRKVGAVVTAEQWGRFQLMASQVPPDSVFVPLADLQRQLDREGRVNVMLSTSDDAAALDARLNQVATLEDLALKLTEVQEGALKEWQVSTDRVFLDDALTGPLLKESGAYGVLTYLVNQLSSPDGKTPYSMATAVPEAVLNQRLAAGKASVEGAWISEWLAEDLQLKSGQELTLRYFVVGQGRELKEETAAIPVAGIVPMSSPAMSAAWTPDFPGVSEAENCRDWEPGIPMDMDAIRDKDEAYWDTYKGTPKVFVPLEQGQKWWHNRFGKLTAVRLPDGGETRAQMAERLMQRVSPRDIGLAAQDLGAAADRAAQGSVDFGGLFVGLSLFLVAGALLFAGLLFVFTLERRVSQIGLLISIGWTQKMVRRALLTEAFLIAIAGVALGLLGGGVYTRAALAGLGGAWADAAQGLQLIYAPQPLTVAVAGLSTLLVVMATLWWVSRRLFTQPPRVLLAGDSGAADAVVARGGWKVWAALIPCLLGAVALLWAGKKATDAEMVAGMFFGAGSLLLAAGLLALRLWMRGQLVRRSRALQGLSSLGELGRLSVLRRPGRSLAVVGMMAGGVFLVTAVNAFRMSADADPRQRDTGTGGFALIGESSLPIYENLTSKQGEEAFGLDAQLMAGVKVVPFRLREGDDASCLNLNRAQQPQLSGVDPKLLAERGAFRFAAGKETGWKALETPAGSEAAIPAIADQATAMWGLGKGVGDTLDFVDESGRTFQVKIVGLLAGSILQGKIIISEQAFLRCYPNAAGYRFFLLDAPEGKTEAVSAHLTRQLETRGLALESAERRLATFQSVQNTYIGIFTVLGGLGVLLGTVGLGVLVARHVLERRGELALMQALGFLGGALRRMILAEHAWLLIAGLALGWVAALAAVWPNLQQGSGSLPLGTLALLWGGALLLGLLVCAVAVRAALRDRLLEALRRE